MNFGHDFLFIGISLLTKALTQVAKVATARRELFRSKVIPYVLLSFVSLTAEGKEKERFYSDATFVVLHS